MDHTHHGATQPDDQAHRTRGRRRATTGTKVTERHTQHDDLCAALRAAELRAETAERQVRRLEGSLAALASTSDQCVWTSTAAGSIGIDLTIQRLFTGHGETNLDALAWIDMLHPDDRERTVTTWAQAVATQSAFGCVMRVRRADGVYRTVLVRAVPDTQSEDGITEWVGTATDVTDQVAQLQRERAAHSEAEAVKAQLQAVLDVLPLGVIIADAKGQLLMSTPAVYQIWGDDAPALDDLTGYHEYTGYWPDTQRRLASEDWALARSLLHGDVIVGEEIAIETFDGERKTILNSTAPIRDANGTIVGGVAAMLDITERKRLEREALERAAQLDATFEALGDAVVIVDEQSRVLRMNAAARGLLVFNVDPADYTALSASEQERQQILCYAAGAPVPWDQWPRFRVTRGEVLQGATAMDLITRGADGRTIYITATGTPIRDANGHIMGGVVVARDETERRQLEQALRTSMADARHRADEVSAILDAITDGVLFYDADGNLVSANTTARRLLSGEDGLPEVWTLPERTITFIARDLNGNALTPEQHPFARIMRGEVLTGSDIVEIETHRLDGSPITISVSGAPLCDERGAPRGAVCVLRDMTSRLSLEKELREREAMFRDTFAQAAVGMAHTGLDGRWIRVNERMCAITGYSREELLNTKFQDITHPDHLEANVALARDLIDDKIQTYTMEKRYIRKNGQQIWVNLTVALVRTPTGAPAYFITVVEDISAHKLLEQQRSELLSIVAHDLGTPLTVMKTRLQVLQRQVAAGKMPDASVAIAAQHALTRMTRLVGDLRDATSADTRQLVLKVASHDLVTLCRMEADAQMQADPERHIELALPNEPVMAEVDGDRIARVLGNLLSNAVKYSPPDQPITLSLECHTAPAQDGPGRAVARIAVSDHGKGIAPEAQPHIFEKFYREPGVHEEQRLQPSLGLGLYICRTLAEEHGGTMNFESTPGQGSIFYLTLPLAHPKQPRP